MIVACGRRIPDDDRVAGSKSGKAEAAETSHCGEDGELSVNSPTGLGVAEQTGTRNDLLWKIFVAALIIRWTYSIVIFLTMGENGLKGVDSYFYVASASNFAALMAKGSVHGWQWFGVEPVIMPLMTWLLTLNALLFGSFAPLSYVLMQGVLDSGTCLLIYGIARAIDPRFALPAALAACINPTQIILAAIVFTDTPFVFFIALYLFAAVRWLRRPSWTSTIWLGTALCAASMIRVLIAPWIPALALFLLASAVLIHRFQIRHFVQILAMIAIAGAGIAALTWRNASQYDHWALTPQTGYHMIGWIAPLVKEARDGTPWADTYEELQERKRTRFGAASENPFVESQRNDAIAREELKNLGMAAIVKAWMRGVAINLVSPAIILSPPVSQLPRTGFFATAGRSFFEKVENFLFNSDNALYAWILQAGILGLMIMRGIQLVGFVRILRNKTNLAIVLLFIGWIAFILAVNGPIASPKYRLPLEPVFAVIAGAGLHVLQQRRRRKIATNDERRAKLARVPE